MFVLFIELDTDSYQAACCNYPEAYISKVRSDYPMADIIWCVQAKPRKARDIVRFLRTLRAEDVEYWRHQEPRTIKKWLFRVG